MSLWCLVVSLLWCFCVGQQLSFEKSSYQAAEDAGSINLTVLRSGVLTGPSSVQYSTVDGSALAARDYATTAGTLRFLPGESSKVISIGIVNNDVFDGNRVFYVLLSNAQGGVLPFPGPGMPVVGGLGTFAVAATISNNDMAVVYLDAGEYVVTPTQTTLSVGVLFVSQPTFTGNVSVTYRTWDSSAKAGLDYEAVSGRLSWSRPFPSSGPVIEPPRLVAIPIKHPATQQGEVSFMVELVDVTGAGATLSTPRLADVTVQPRLLIPLQGAIHFTESSYSVLESPGVGFSAPRTATTTGSTVSSPAEASVLRVGVERTLGSAGTVAVHFATADYTAQHNKQYLPTEGDLIWDNGDTAIKYINVAALADEDISDKMFTLTLSNVRGGAVISDPSSVIVTVLNTDEPTVFLFAQPSYEFGENAGVARVDVVRTGASATMVSVDVVALDGNATAPWDYTPLPRSLGSQGYRLVFAEGIERRSLSVPITFSPLRNANVTHLVARWFALQLVNPIGAGLPPLTDRTAVVTLRPKRYPESCADHPCQHGATCVSSGSERFDAVYASTADYMHPVSFACVCPVGFTGLLCAVDEDNCASGPCDGLHGRATECIDGVNSYSCACQAGLFGRWCNETTPSSSALPANDNPDTPADSDVPPRPTGCELVPPSCLNGGTCIAGAASAAFECQCTADFTGPTCAVTARNNSTPLIGDACLNAPCAGFAGFNGTAFARGQVAQPWTGGVDLQRRFRCLSLAGGAQFQCVCDFGVLGALCDSGVGTPSDGNACAGVVCHNGGRCLPSALSPSGSAYICQCALGYSGPLCETSLGTASGNSSSGIVGPAQGLSQEEKRIAIGVGIGAGCILAGLVIASFLHWRRHSTTNRENGATRDSETKDGPGDSPHSPRRHTIHTAASSSSLASLASSALSGSGHRTPVVQMQPILPEHAYTSVPSTILEPVITPADFEVKQPQLSSSGQKAMPDDPHVRNQTSPSPVPLPPRSGPGSGQSAPYVSESGLARHVSPKLPFGPVPVPSPARPYNWV